MALETDKLLPDGTRRRTSVNPEGVLTIERSMDTSALLEQNKLMRDEGLVKQKDDIHWMLSIPEFDWYVLCQKYPDLNCGVPHIEDQAMRRFMNSTEAAPYKVTG